MLAISGEQPYPGCSRRAAVHWTVGISRLGVAARGVGELVPPPLSLTLQAPCFSLPAFLRGIPMHFCRRPPPRPCLRRSSPAPSRGRGQCLRYQVGSRARFFPRISPCSGPWGYRHGGWRLAGRGNSFPLPCLQLPRHRNPCGPTPPAPAALLPRPIGGGVRAWRYQVSSRARGGAGGKSYLGWSWWETVSGVEPVSSRARFFSRFSPCAGPWGYRVWGWRLAGRGNSFPLPCL